MEKIAFHIKQVQQEEMEYISNIIDQGAYKSLPNDKGKLSSYSLMEIR